MRFMMFHKSNEANEAGVPPTPELMAGMGKLMEDMAKAGVLLAADGLQPSSKGARVNYANGKLTVTDGPFAEAKELIAGYAILQVNSKEEVYPWAERFFHVLGEGEGEIRQMFDADDFGPEFTPEAKEAEARLRQQLAAKR